MKKILLLFFSIFLLANIGYSQCTGLQVYGIRSDNTDEIYLLATTTIPANAVFYLTDNEWNSTTNTGFIDINEDEAIWTAPSNGLAAGSIIKLKGTTASCGTISATPPLGDTGDALYITNVSPTISGMTTTDICFGISFGNTMPETAEIDVQLTLDNVVYSGSGDITVEANWSGDNDTSLVVFPSAMCLPTSCSLTSAGLVVGSCNNAGTAGNITSDDYFSFTLNPTGSSLGSSYNVTGSFSGSPVSSVSYGSAQTIGSSQLISSGAFTVTITDAATATCTTTITVTPPATCSNDPLAPITLITQAVNPCASDGHNEFIIASTGTTSVNIADIAFGSASGALATEAGDNINFWWAGSAVQSNPYDISGLSTTSPETCSNSGTALQCYGFLYPSTDAATYTTVLDSLNGCAGCNVFIAVPSTNQIPPNSKFIIFLSRGTCTFDTPCSNLNFSTWCSAGSPLEQLYVVIGTGDGNQGCNNYSSGYFSNNDPRTAYLMNYSEVGSNTLVSNYNLSSQVYDPNNTAAGFNTPTGFIYNQPCVPAPSIIAVLPIQMKSFDARKTDDGVALTWVTSSETNNAYYIVERSGNGIDYREIGRMSGAGTTTEEMRYNFIDKNPLSARNYYRIVQVDFDGKMSNSNIKTITYNSYSDDYIFVTPNPAQSWIDVSISYSSSVAFDLQIIDINGRLVRTTSINNNESEYTRLDVSELPNGMYFLKIPNSGVYSKFIKN
ncbi:MAG: T9SS type A sorting domain-containing protein [Saprospiraceae bacterium]|nr:T9SS type A sorting domain-containing protein [Saprospiraceae bacterium]